MKIKYRAIKMGTKNKDKLARINEIIEKYQAQGYRLTLRQLYYQLVIENAIPNATTEYQKLSVLLKEGRMAGVVDWDAIEDRLRYPSQPYYDLSPEDAVNDMAGRYRLQRQKGQKTYIEVWVEKDALSGVLKRVTEPLGVPIVVNRGYSSASAMHDAYKRFSNAHRKNKKIIVIYLGDFDPSGLDMIRDIKRRIGEFVDGGGYEEIDFEILPIALTAQQIDQYKPPKNPAKMKDPRAPEYVAKYGLSSWEVDALEPSVLHSLLDDNIRSIMDIDVYDDILEQEETDKEKLENLKDYL